MCRAHCRCSSYRRREHARRPAGARQAHVTDVLAARHGAARGLRAPGGCGHPRQPSAARHDAALRGCPGAHRRRVTTTARKVSPRSRSRPSYRQSPPVSTTTRKCRSGSSWIVFSQLRDMSDRELRIVGDILEVGRSAGRGGLTDPVLPAWTEPFVPEAQAGARRRRRSIVGMGRRDRRGGEGRDHRQGVEGTHPVVAVASSAASPCRSSMTSRRSSMTRGSTCTATQRPARASWCLAPEQSRSTRCASGSI